jgi:hypothetical protein
MREHRDQPVRDQKAVRDPVCSNFLIPPELLRSKLARPQGSSGADGGVQRIELRYARTLANYPA